jgi:flagellar motor switch protein FliM
LRALRLEHGVIIDTLATRLSSYLRMELSMRLGEVEALPYQRLVEGVATPCHLTLFKVEPWRGICLLDLNPKLALAISDRLLGGKGIVPAEARDLSSVEIALLDQVVQLILNEWCGHWSKFQPLSPAVLGHENSARVLRSSQPDAMMIVVGVEARLGESVEQMQMAFPGTTLEPVLQDLRLKANLRLDAAAELPAAGKVKWKRDFDHIQLSVAARSSAMKLTTGQLAHLAIGDVIPLPPEFSARIQLCLAGAPKFAGRLGTCESNWAVEITEVLRT